MKTHFLTSLAIILVFSSCSTTYSWQEYLEFLNDSRNGFIKSKDVNDISISVKHLPQEYLAINESLNLSDTPSNTLVDSVSSLYKNSLAFLLVLDPKDLKNRSIQQNDVMLKGIASLPDFAQRVSDLNFNMENLISIEVGDSVVHPTLVQLENIYGMKDSRKWMVVFPKDKVDVNQGFTFVFDDNTFMTGRSKFYFDQVSKAPQLTQIQL